MQVFQLTGSSARLVLSSTLRMRALEYRSHLHGHHHCVSGNVSGSNAATLMGDDMQRKICMLRQGRAPAQPPQAVWDLNLPKFADKGAAFTLLTWRKTGGKLNWEPLHHPCPDHHHRLAVSLGTRRVEGGGECKFIKGGGGQQI